ncbi:MAG: holo-ACP synthase [Actinomycetota bacterium]
MIRLGIDVVDIERLASRMATWPRLADRLFTPAEQAYCLGKPRPPQHFAVRVAAKEAAFKALGEGWPKLRWVDIEVVAGRERSRPELVLTGRASVLAAGATALLSLTHDAGIAIAEVLLVD